MNSMLTLNTTFDKKICFSVYVVVKTEMMFLLYIDSACVQELMNVAYETLTEASDGSEQCATQLFFAVRNMFELFCSVTPTFHRDSLLKFPQLSGRNLRS